MHPKLGDTKLEQIRQAIVIVLQSGKINNGQIYEKRLGKTFWHWQLLKFSVNSSINLEIIISLTSNAPSCANFRTVSYSNYSI